MAHPYLERRLRTRPRLAGLPVRVGRSYFVETTDAAVAVTTAWREFCADTGRDRTAKGLRYDVGAAARAPLYVGAEANGFEVVWATGEAVEALGR